MSKEIVEQLALFENKNELKTICKLKHSNKPLKSKVEIDDQVKEVAKNFDYDFLGENVFYPYEYPKVLDEIDYNILCIVGASGSGKSTFSKHFGEPKKIEWDNNKSIVSNFVGGGNRKTMCCWIK